MARYRDYLITNSTDLINQLFNMFVQKEYGDIIYHTEVEKILGFGKELSKYGVYVRKAKDKLIPYSKILKSIPRSRFPSVKACSSIRFRV